MPLGFSKLIKKERMFNVARHTPIDMHRYVNLR